MSSKLETIQICVVGSKSSGKTTLVHKYLHNQFKEGFPVTLSIQHYTKIIEIQSRKYNLLLGDSQGFDLNTGIMLMPQYKKFQGFIVVYDITDKNSFENAKLCLRQIKEECRPENQNIFVIGNKNDLPAKRQVPAD